MKTQSSSSSPGFGPGNITWLVCVGLCLVPIGLNHFDREITGDALVVIVGSFFYFIPAMNADARRHRQRVPIYLLNLLLGFTIIGWIVALIWSTSANIEPEAETAP